jgi:Na+-driven multidrug efflux pump
MAQVGCLACFYLIGVPLGSALGFLTNMQSAGLVFGLIIAQLSLNIYYAYLLWFKFDWDEITREIAETINSDESK